MPVPHAAADVARDLRTIDRSASPNDALACPADGCAATPDVRSPVLVAAPAEILRRAEALFLAEPRVELVSRVAEPEQLVFVQRSRLFGFPDEIRIQPVAVAGGTSVAIYSRSRYGYWDMGVNRARVRSWLSKLTEALGTAD